jgi:hypothetical protein
MNSDAASEHTLVHVRNALATDGRVGELGLDVRLRGDAVVVRGAVSTETRRQGVTALVAEVLQAHGVDLRVVNETSVPASDEPDERPERL